MAEWSMLPFDLLSEIALKLESTEDLIYFSVVCHSWYHAYSLVKKKWSAKTPWLMLPENTTDNPHCLRKLFCLGNQKSYQFQLPQTFGARCWGTSSGWVVTLDLNLEIYLFNPFTKVRIRLPPQPTMPNQPSPDNEWIRTCFLRKVFVYNDDGCEDDIIVMALIGYNYGGLVYARPGDEAWTPMIIRKDHESILVDVLCWGSKILILYDNGAIRCCEIGAIQNSQPVMVMEYLPPPSEEILGPLHEGIYGSYLLESFGDLLIVLRYKEEVADPNDHTTFDANVYYQTIAFEVFKLNSATNNWKVVKDLGDVALFVGNNCSMSLDASKMKNCKSNCIYFTDDECEFWDIPTRNGGHDMGIFRMKDEEFEPMYEGDDIRSNFCTALWFLPKYF